MINCSREEFQMRIDVVNHLQNFGMDQEFLEKHVIFNDDIENSNSFD